MVELAPCLLNAVFLSSSGMSVPRIIEVRSVQDVRLYPPKTEAKQKPNQSGLPAAPQTEQLLTVCDDQQTEKKQSRQTTIIAKKKTLKKPYILVITKNQNKILKNKSQ